MNTAEIQQLRQVIQRTLSELGMSDRDWCCVAARNPRRDQTGLPPAGVLAVWSRDENVLEFYAEDGRQLTTVHLARQFSHPEKAA
jgi:hypothetical protein